MKTININIDKLVDVVIIGDEFKFKDEELKFIKDQNSEINCECLEMLNNFET